MKIAFVGKGGSGKSTVTALFIHHLLEQKQRVLAVDADINQHLAGLIGAKFDPTSALSDEMRRADIRRILVAENPRIIAEHMVKTTPPGTGSHLVRLLVDDPIIQKYSETFADNAYFMHVGTYSEDGIGTSCYHGNLAVFENIVSHTVLTENEWLVADMVAGTDAFAGALYLMFDAIVLVVEPTPESVGVYRQFMQLATTAGVASRVYVVANKVADEDDATFLTDELGALPTVAIAYDPELKRARQRGHSIRGFGAHYASCEGLMVRLRRSVDTDRDARLRELQALHRHYGEQDFVREAHGDLGGQIDGEFRYDDTTKA